MNDRVSPEQLVSAAATVLGRAGAITQILFALRSADIHATCAKFSGLNPRSLSDSEFPEEASDYVLPAGFWYNSSWSIEGESSQVLIEGSRDFLTTVANWQTGEFTFSGTTHEGKRPFMRRALGVTLYREEASAFLSARSIAAEWESLSVAASNSNLNEITPTGAGRRPANWWPDFAEELAVYFHQNGFPSGQGTDGQSQVIDAIFQQLTDRGKPEPGRTTVQPVVSAVLNRLRKDISAGN